MPSAEEIQSLHLSAGTPVAELHRIAYSKSGEAVEFFRAILAGDRHIFGYEFDAPE
jgi:GntR family transcriptional regulator